MKKFLIKTFIFLSILVISFLSIFLTADGYTDPFYVRFATPKQTSLILGNSRAAQGVLPEYLNKKLSRDDIFNYAFTIGHSPYGPAYLSSIKRKLKENTKDGIFILTVDPWSLSTSEGNVTSEEDFPENERMLGITTVVDQNPNLQYLLNSYESSYFELFKPQGSFFLHDDGWLEINVSMDSTFLKERTLQKLAEYKDENLPKYKFSNKRLEYLKKTIVELKRYGHVYLVRLPIHPEMLRIEEILISDFDEKMHDLEEAFSVPYFNMTGLNDQFVYTDGNHLHKQSGREVSMLIADWIAQ